MKPKAEIDRRLDELVSELMEEYSIDNWYYISHRLEFIAENIRRANAIELTEDYVRACFKTFMEKCNEDI